MGQMKELWADELALAEAEVRHASRELQRIEVEQARGRGLTTDEFDALLLPYERRLVRARKAVHHLLGR